MGLRDDEMTSDALLVYLEHGNCRLSNALSARALNPKQKLQVGEILS